MIICENALQVKLVVEAWSSCGGKGLRTFSGSSLKILTSKMNIFLFWNQVFLPKYFSPLQMEIVCEEG